MRALEMVGIGLDFPGRPRLLRDVSLHVDPGEVVVVEGRSGSGKSSLLAVAAGLEPPARGRVRVMGREWRAGDGSDAAAWRGRNVGLLFQHLHLLPELNVAENVALPLRLHGATAREADARARELCGAFGLTGLARRRPDGLSGGEQQRVAIARALATRPGLLLVDEPTNNLDDHNARQVIAALRQAAAAGAGVLVATHDPLVRAAGRVLRLDGGQLGAAP